MKLLVVTNILIILFRTALSYGVPAASTTTETNIIRYPLNITLDPGANYDDYTPDTETPSLKKRKFQAFVVCETTSGSPWTRDVRAAGDRLLKKATICQQGNPARSRCTQMTDSGSAAIGICGPVKSEVHCRTAGKVGHAVAELCNRNGLAGGYGQYEWGRIVVYVP